MFVSIHAEITLRAVAVSIQNKIVATGSQITSVSNYTGPATTPLE
jgi:hypothetical protein